MSCLLSHVSLYANIKDLKRSQQYIFSQGYQNMTELAKLNEAELDRNLHTFFDKVWYVGVVGCSVLDGGVDRNLHSSTRQINENET